MNYQKKIINHGIVCAHPLPNILELKEYYATKYYQDANSTTTYDVNYAEAELQHKILESDIAILAIKENFKSLQKPLSLLEFGCGEGFFLNQAAKEGWQIHGIDFSKFAIEKWHPHLETHCSFGDSYEYLNKFINEKKKFDVCVLRNVLEHVLDPEKLLTNLKNILKPNGLLLITVPNDYSAVQKLASDLGHINQEFWFSPPDHLYYFNTRNIIPFIQDLKYEIKDMYSSFPVDFFLYHHGSNYVTNKANGKAAHLARVKLDLLMAESGVPNLLNLYRAMAKCGVGRDFTIILSQ